MKRIVFALGAMLFTGYLMANGTVKESTIVVAQADTIKEKISEDQLPAAVKTTLAKDEYKDWKVDAVYLYKKEYYQVVLKKDMDTRTVNFDKDGKLVI